MENSKPYLLLHMTSESNSKKIEKTQSFIFSKHDVKKGKNQWLGDGVYFWDGNDDKSIPFEKKIIKKHFNEKIVGMFFLVDIKKERHMNLEIDYWKENFERFVRSIYPEKQETVIEYLNMIREKDFVDRKDLYKIGNLLGNALNNFLEYLLKEENIEIDMVSCYFYHKKNNNLLFSKNEIVIRQFCIKNSEILNESFKNLKIEYNI